MNDEPRAIRGCLYSLAGVIGLTAALLLAVVLMGTCTRAASAEPDVLGSETSRTLEFLSQGVHLGIMDGPDEPYIPDDMRRGALFVLPCENALLAPDVVSATGDLGIFQVSGYWQRERIARMGFTQEDMLTVGPNVQVATAIWKEQNWRPWACRSAIR